MIALQFKNISDSLRFRKAEWGCAAACAGWGWIIVQPHPTFGNPSFEVMRTWAHEEVWGWGALLVGLAGLVVMVYNGRFRHWPEARLIMAVTRSFIWFCLVWGMARANIGSPSIAAYSVFLAMDLHTIYTGSYEAAQLKEARRHGAL